MSTRKIKDAKDLSTNELIYFKSHAKATYMSDGTTVEDAINNIEVDSGVDLSDYATKEELSNKQDTITDLETIRQGAAKGTTALQSYTEQYKGTVTGVKVNGTTKNPSNGVVDLGTIITSHQDISGKQDKLVSGTNIKTINGESILGEGDLTTDIVVASKEELEALDVPSGTRARIFTEIPGTTYNNLNLGRILNATETNPLPPDFYENIINYTFNIEVDTSVTFPYDETAEHIRVEIPTYNSILVYISPDYSSIKNMTISIGFTENLYYDYRWYSYKDSIRALDLNEILSFDDDLFMTLLTIAPAFNGYITIPATIIVEEYTKTSQGWIKTTVSEEELVLFLELVSAYIPYKTSQLENDSNFVSSDNLKTINGQSIVGSGDITISSGGSSSGSGGNEDVVKGLVDDSGEFINGIVLPNGRELYISDGNTLATISNVMYKLEFMPVGTLSEIEECFHGNIEIIYFDFNAVQANEYLCHIINDEGNRCGLVIGVITNWENNTIEISIITYDGRLITINASLDTIDNNEIHSNEIQIIDLKNGGSDSSSGSGGSCAYSEVNHGTSDTTFTLTPNTFHVWDEVTILDLDFGEETTGIANEFLFQFTSGSEPTTLTLPDNIIWATQPIIQAEKTYQVSILNNLGTILEF